LRCAHTGGWNRRRVVTGEGGATRRVPRTGGRDRVLDVYLAIVSRWSAVRDSSVDIAPGLMARPIVVLHRQSLGIGRRPAHVPAPTDVAAGTILARGTADPVVNERQSHSGATLLSMSVTAWPTVSMSTSSASSIVI